MDDSRQNAGETAQRGVQEAYTFEGLQDYLIALHREKSLRRIAREVYQNRVTIGTVGRVIQGIEPKTSQIREIFGLAPASMVIPVAGSVPDGTQVIAASRCSCGRYFVPNHPRRQKCFICSPYRPHKKGV